MKEDSFEDTPQRAPEGRERRERPREGGQLPRREEGPARHVDASKAEIKQAVLSRIDDLSVRAALGEYGADDETWLIIAGVLHASMSAGAEQIEEIRKIVTSGAMGSPLDRQLQNFIESIQDLDGRVGRSTSAVMNRIDEVSEQVSRSAKDVGSRVEAVVDHIVATQKRLAQHSPPAAENGKISLSAAWQNIAAALISVFVTGMIFGASLMYYIR